MGISSAMTPKERKQIHNGLLEQGCTVVRDGKRGTLYVVPSGARWMLPFGTSDNKARLAMRAEIKRLGLHWPLDTGDTPKKEKEPMTAQTLERPLLDHKKIPAQAENYKKSGKKPREELYRANEPVLRGFADRTFWTDEYTEAARAAGMTGFGRPGTPTSAGNGTSTIWLDFAGFKVIEAKPNRGGTSYRWARDEREPWPNSDDLFAPKVTGAAKMRQDGLLVTPTKHDADVVEADLAASSEPIVHLAPEPEAVPQGDKTDEDIELDLAVEMEQRAERAERALEVAKREFRADLQGFEESRRTLLRRIAEMEGMLNQRDTLIARTTSERDEARHLLAESATFATVDEAANAALVARDNLITEMGEQIEFWKQRAADATAASGAVQQATPGDDGWWPLEGGNQTVSQLIDGAESFGLEVRIQARRK